MIQRRLQYDLLRALKDTPVLFVNGPRQSGKSTLVKALAEHAHPAEYITFDEAPALAGAQADPAGFLRNLTTNIALDEVQRVPELFLAIKAEVDRARKPGRFMLTGSANVLLLPRLADSLAGRMDIFTLYPFSQGEIEGTKERFVDMMFSSSLSLSRMPPLTKSNLFRRLLIGGFPEAVRRTDERSRQSWFGSYVTTILQRDIRDLANIEGLAELPRVLTLLASRSSTLLNIAELSNSTTIPQTTLKRYLTLMETTYLIQFLPAWSSNLGTRLIKTPKVMLCDTGLSAHLQGVNTQQLTNQPTLFGHLLENFVAMELAKQCTWSDARPQMFHFRTLRGQEVDLLLEDKRRRVVGIEVKSSATVTAADFKNLKVLAEIAGKSFHRGIVLYSGSDIIPFGKKLFAVPIVALWKLGV